MRVAILSRGNQVYSTRRLVEAAELSGHQAQILDPFGFSLHVQNDNIRIFYNGYVGLKYSLISPHLALYALSTRLMPFKTHAINLDLCASLLNIIFLYYLVSRLGLPNH